MSDHTSDGKEAGHPPGGSPPAANGHTHESKKKTSPKIPTPLKKSKRQAERMARGAFAASLRKEEEEDRLYQPKKNKSNKRPKPDSDNNPNNNANSETNTKQSLSNEEASQEVLQVVTPSPTRSSDSSKLSKVVAQSDTIPITDKRSKTSPSGETGSRNAKRPRDKDKSIPDNRKRQKFVYRAMSGPKGPIYDYALQLVSLVCNNAYSVTKSNSGNHNKSTSKSPSPKIDTARINYNSKNTMLKFLNQPHMVLDRPSSGYTQDSEPIKERLMRLQLRQRFASAVSIGMSPIEFARKLLKLWGGTLEQVYETTKAKANAISIAAKTKDGKNHASIPKKTTARTIVSSKKKKNNFSSSMSNNMSITSELSEQRKIQSKLGQDLATMSNEGLKAAIESCDFNKCIGDLEPRSIHPDAQFGECNKTNGNNDLCYANNVDANSAFFDSNHHILASTNTIFNFQHNNASTDFNTHILGESKDRIERPKKILKRKHRKNLKKSEEEVLAVSLSSSMPVDTLEPATATSGGKPQIERVDKARASQSKSKLTKRIVQKLTDDPSIPVLFKGMRLSHPDDDDNLNALHCFVRAKLLEVYVLQGEKGTVTTDSHSSQHEKDVKNENKNNENKVSDEDVPNIVGIRCAFCGSLSRQERGKGQLMSAFFPKTIGEIYRGVCTWQRIHFPICEHMPEDYRIEYKIRKESDLTRGRKAHWITSAFDLGLRNVDSARNGLTYKPESLHDLEEILKIKADLRDRSSKAKKGSTKRLRSSSKIEGHMSGGNIQGSDFTGVDDEFELFGTEFDRSFEESTDALTANLSDEAAF